MVIQRGEFQPETLVVIRFWWINLEESVLIRDDVFSLSFYIPFLLLVVIWIPKLHPRPGKGLTAFTMEHKIIQAVINVGNVGEIKIFYRHQIFLHSEFFINTGEHGVVANR